MKIEVTVFHVAKACTIATYEIPSPLSAVWKVLRERGMRITCEAKPRQGSIAISLDHPEYTTFAIELILYGVIEDEIVEAIETLLERVDFVKLDRWFVRMVEINKRILLKEENREEQVDAR